jgi:LysM repeat protein
MDTGRDGRRRAWQTNLIVTAGVMATLLFGLALAQLDALQARTIFNNTGLLIINIQATAIAVGQVFSLEIDPQATAPVLEPVVPIPDDLNPRPEFITGVSEEGVIFTICGEVPEGWLLYTVQPGETLASLAVGTETAAADLAAANCLNENQVTAGMQLLVPRQPAPTLCGPPQWWVRYQVRPGDTMASLASNRVTTIDEILRANCRDSQELVVGQLIFLPPGTQPGAPASIPQPSLTPLPTPTSVPTLAPLPTVTSPPPTLPPPPPPTPTSPVVFPTATRPTATPPPLPTEPPPPTLTPQPPPTNPPPTPPPPTQPPPTAPPPTQPPPTQPPPTAPPPTAPPPTEPPPTEPPPTEPPPTEPPPTEPPPTEVPP